MNNAEYMALAYWQKQQQRKQHNPYRFYERWWQAHCVHGRIESTAYPQIQQFLDDLWWSNGLGKVVSSDIKNGNYYAAVRLCNQMAIFPVIAVLDIKPQQHQTIYQAYSENQVPFNLAYAQCPRSIMSLLTPTNDGHAYQWRNQCLRQ